MSQLSDNAKELGDLKSKVETRHTSSLDERESAAKSRDEQLKGVPLCSTFRCFSMLFVVIDLSRGFSQLCKDVWRGSSTTTKWSEPDCRASFPNWRCNSPSRAEPVKRFVHTNIMMYVLSLVFRHSAKQKYMFDFEGKVEVTPGRNEAENNTGQYLERKGHDA